MTLTIPGFRYERVTVASGVSLHTAMWLRQPRRVTARIPQTHLMRRHVAADLAAEHTVICPDLRGYGGSDKPAENGPGTMPSGPWPPTS
jgi:haloacetate dehalogenase